jgi:ABC-type sugar transport system substrate-binding protein
MNRKSRLSMTTLGALALAALLPLGTAQAQEEEKVLNIHSR